MESFLRLWRVPWFLFKSPIALAFPVMSFATLVLLSREGEALESYVTKRRDLKKSWKLQIKSMKRCGQPDAMVADPLRSYGAAMKAARNFFGQETGRSAGGPS